MNVILIIVSFALAVLTQWRAGANFFAYYRALSLPLLTSALALHALSSAMFLAGGYLWRRGRGGRGILLQFMGLAWTAFPAVGPVMALLSAVVLWRRDDQRSNLGTLLARAEAELAVESGDILADLADAEGVLKTASDARRDAAGVRPYRELLLTASDNDKMEVIRRVRKLGSRDALEILNLARTDRGYGVRHLATTAVATIEQEWQNEAAMMRESVEADPTSARPRNDLLMHYILGCNAGVFLPKVARLHLLKALDEAKICVQLVPNEPESFYKLGQLYGMLDDFGQSLAALDHAIALKPDGANFRFWRAEVLFRLGRLAEVREECRIIASLDPHPKIAKLVNFWITSSEDFHAA